MNTPWVIVINKTVYARAMGTLTAAILAGALIENLLEPGPLTIHFRRYSQFPVLWREGHEEFSIVDDPQRAAEIMNSRFHEWTTALREKNQHEQ